VEKFIKELNNPDEVRRIYAAQDIAETGNSELSLHLLNKLPAEESQAVRDALVFALRTLPCSGIYENIFKLFRSPDAYLRNAAIDIFGSEGHAAIPFLTSHLNHADREVRKLILDALFSIGAPDAIQAIRSALRDPSVNVRITAVEYLGRLEDKESAKEMVNLLQEETEPMLKIGILESLSLIADREDILNVFSILIPNLDFSRADSLYLPCMIRLSGKIGDPEIIAGLGESIPNLEMYAEDILHAIEQAAAQFKDTQKTGRILNLINRIIKESRDSAIHALCEELNKCLGV
jgi:HEAT repeat protein